MQQDDNQEIIPPSESSTEKPFVPPIPEYPTLRPKPWTKVGGDNPPPKPPSKLGKRNRKTIIRELLELAASKKWRDQHKEFGWEYEPQSLRDQVNAAWVLKALAGDMTAIQALYDGEFGKLPTVTGEKPEGEKSHDEILRDMLDNKPKQLSHEDALKELSGESNEQAAAEKKD